MTIYEIISSIVGSIALLIAIFGYLDKSSRNKLSTIDADKKEINDLKVRIAVLETKVEELEKMDRKLDKILDRL